MAGWSILTDVSSSDCMQILHNLQKNGYCLDLDLSMKAYSSCGGDANSKEDIDKLRCMFDKILSTFLREFSEQEKIIRPLPAMLGNGSRVDMFKLFRLVKEKGGYEGVVTKRLWGLIAEESGLGSSEIGSSLKLIYAKYLYKLDRWSHIILKNKGLLPVDLDVGIDGLSHTNDRMSPVVDSQVSMVQSDGKRCVDDDDEDVVILDHRSVVHGEEFGSLKRKRESLLGMLNWVKMVSKNPCDFRIRKFPEGSRRKGFGDMEYWAQARLARAALLRRKSTRPSVVGLLLPKRQKMHPSMYEDYLSVYHTDKIRYSQRILSQHTTSQMDSCLVTSRVPDNDMNESLIPCVAGLDNHSDKQSLGNFASLTARVGMFCVDEIEKRIPVGPLFQAEVPDWIGVVPSDPEDSKWLGTELWPPELKELNSLTKMLPIGQGRPASCTCQLPGSVECVRFHVAEKRFVLKRELGSAFYTWRFNKMGEEVSLSWSEEEEQRFKAVVRRNPPSLDKSFWDPAYRCFPSKSKQSLVSYYFNVFLYRRRSYQNRVTPNRIDSDDDESEFGYISSGFGRNAVKVRESIFCSQNKQCMDLDDSTDVD